MQLELLELTREEGIIACALVAVDTGMVYASTMHHTEFEIIAEAARDYWVLHHKSRQAFERLGDVRNISVQHQKGLVNVQPFDDGIILITLAKIGKVNWQQWRERIEKARLACSNALKNTP